VTVLRAALVALGIALLAGTCAGGERPVLSDETTPPRACSAEGMVVPELSGEGQPGPVADARIAIIEAARACDYAALADLAAPGPMVATIDGRQVPVTEWEAEEEQGEPVLRSVAGVLTLEPAEAAEDGAVTWPSAVDWPFSDVGPADERRALVAVVGEEGVFGWAETGGYAGWRTTIGADGVWRSVTRGPVPD
jgi:hypothetical protein